MKFPSLVCLILFGVTFISSNAEPVHADAKRIDIFDRQADGCDQVNRAVETAKKEHKRVLVQLGTNWDGWCRKLHHILTENAGVARAIKANYVHVLVDVDRSNGQQHNLKVDESLGRPTRFGLPALIILDSNGSPLATQDMSKFEDGDNYNTLKIVTFLAKWKSDGAVSMTGN